MVFVCAAANLRAACYGIPAQTLYDAKGIAGNIIPAIATTNAIVAGIQISQLVKIIKAKKRHANGGDPQHTERVPLRSICSYVYARREPTPRGGYLIQPTTLDEPQADCYVCRKATVTIGVDFFDAADHRMTLRRFVDAVVVAHLNFVRPAIDVGDSGLYDPDDSRLAANLDKPLGALPGVRDGCVLSATDFATDLELSVIVRHVAASHALFASDETNAARGFVVLSAADVAALDAAPTLSKEEAEHHAEHTTTTTNGKTTATTTTKRPREDEKENASAPSPCEPPSKKKSSTVGVGV